MVDWLRDTAGGIVQRGWQALAADHDEEERARQAVEEQKRQAAAAAKAEEDARVNDELARRKQAMTEQAMARLNQLWGGAQDLAQQGADYAAQSGVGQAVQGFVDRQDDQPPEGQTWRDVTNQTLDQQGPTPESRRQTEEVLDQPSPVTQAWESPEVKALRDKVTEPGSGPEYLTRPIREVAQSLSGVQDEVTKQTDERLKEYRGMPGGQVWAAPAVAMDVPGALTGAYAAERTRANLGPVIGEENARTAGEIVRAPASLVGSGGLSPSKLATAGGIAGAAHGAVTGWQDAPEGSTNEERLRGASTRAAQEGTTGMAIGGLVHGAASVAGATRVGQRLTPGGITQAMEAELQAAAQAVRREGAGADGVISPEAQAYADRLLSIANRMTNPRQAMRDAYDALAERLVPQIMRTSSEEGGAPRTAAAAHHYLQGYLQGRGIQPHEYLSVGAAQPNQPRRQRPIEGEARPVDERYTDDYTEPETPLLTGRAQPSAAAGLVEPPTPPAAPLAPQGTGVPSAPEGPIAGGLGRPQASQASQAVKQAQAEIAAFRKANPGVRPPPNLVAAYDRALEESRGRAAEQEPDAARREAERLAAVPQSVAPDADQPDAGIWPPGRSLTQAPTEGSAQQPMFQSALGEALKNLPPNATKAQVEAATRSVTAEEKKWSGYDAMVGPLGDGDPVDVNALSQTVAQNTPDVQMVAKGEGQMPSERQAAMNALSGTTNALAAMQPQITQDLRSLFNRPEWQQSGIWGANDDPEWDIDKMTQPGPVALPHLDRMINRIQRARGWLDPQEMSREARLFQQITSAWRQSIKRQEQAAAAGRDTTNQRTLLPGGEQRHEQYTVPGGTNHRNLLITLGKVPGDDDIRALGPQGASGRELYQGPTGHYPEFNVTNALRVSTRPYTKPDGTQGQMLFVEEDQGDLEKALREQSEHTFEDDQGLDQTVPAGVPTRPTGSQYRDLTYDWYQWFQENPRAVPTGSSPWNELAQEIQNRHPDVDSGDTAFWQLQQSAAWRAAQRYWQDLVEANQGQPPGILDPLVDSAKAMEAWAHGSETQMGAIAPDLPLAREYQRRSARLLLRYAADNGFDAVGWAPGEEHALRWGADEAEASRRPVAAKRRAGLIQAYNVRLKQQMEAAFGAPATQEPPQGGQVGMQNGTAGAFIIPISPQARERGRQPQPLYMQRQPSVGTEDVQAEPELQNEAGPGVSNVEEGAGEYDPEGGVPIEEDPNVSEEERQAANQPGGPPFDPRRYTQPAGTVVGAGAGSLEADEEDRRRRAEGLPPLTPLERAGRIGIGAVAGYGMGRMGGEAIRRGGPIRMGGSPPLVRLANGMDGAPTPLDRVMGEGATENLGRGQVSESVLGTHPEGEARPGMPAVERGGAPVPASEIDITGRVQGTGRDLARTGEVDPQTGFLQKTIDHKLQQVYDASGGDIPDETLIALGAPAVDHPVGSQRALVPPGPRTFSFRDPGPDAQYVSHEVDPQGNGGYVRVRNSDGVEMDIAITNSQGLTRDGRFEPVASSHLNYLRAAYERAIAMKDFYPDFGALFGQLAGAEPGVPLTPEQMKVAQYLINNFGATAGQASPELNLEKTLRTDLAARHWTSVQDEPRQPDVPELFSLVHSKGSPYYVRGSINRGEVKKALAIMSGGAVNVGSNYKTPVFGQNTMTGLLGTFDPNDTPDTHMLRMGGSMMLGTKPSSTANQNKVSTALNGALTAILARELGITPNQLQSALWYVTKEENAPKPWDKVALKHDITMPDGNVLPAGTVVGQGTLPGVLDHNYDLINEWKQATAGPDGQPTLPTPEAGESVLTHQGGRTMRLQTPASVAAGQPPEKLVPSSITPQRLQLAQYRAEQTAPVVNVSLSSLGADPLANLGIEDPGWDDAQRQAVHEKLLTDVLGAYTAGDGKQRLRVLDDENIAHVLVPFRSSTYEGTKEYRISVALPGSTPEQARYVGALLGRLTFQDGAGTLHAARPGVDEERLVVAFHHPEGKVWTPEEIARYPWAQAIAPLADESTDGTTLAFYDWDGLGKDAFSEALGAKLEERGLTEDDFLAHRTYPRGIGSGYVHHSEYGAALVRPPAGSVRTGRGRQRPALGEPAGARGTSDLVASLQSRALQTLIDAGLNVPDAQATLRAWNDATGSSQYLKPFERTGRPSETALVPGERGQPRLPAAPDAGPPPEPGGRPASPFTGGPAGLVDTEGLRRSEPTPEPGFQMEPMDSGALKRGQAGRDAAKARVDAALARVRARRGEGDTSLTPEEHRALEQTLDRDRQALLDEGKDGHVSYLDALIRARARGTSVRPDLLGGLAAEDWVNDGVSLGEQQVLQEAVNNEADALIAKRAGASDAPKELTFEDLPEDAIRTNFNDHGRFDSGPMFAVGDRLNNANPGNRMARFANNVAADLADGLGPRSDRDIRGWALEEEVDPVFAKRIHDEVLERYQSILVDGAKRGWLPGYTPPPPPSRGVTFEDKPTPMRPAEKGPEKRQPGEIQGPTASERLAGDEVSDADIVEGQTDYAQATVDLQHLIDQMKSSLYEKNQAAVITKELVQNSVDAIMPNGAGKIQVDLYPDARTITIDDDGIGMSPSTVRNVFVKISGSYKPGLEGKSRGSFGAAKVAILGASEDAKLVTQWKNPQTGEVWRTVLEGNRNDWTSQGFPVTSYRVTAPGEQWTGTKLYLELDPALPFDNREASDYLRQMATALTLPVETKIFSHTSYGTDDDLSYLVDWIGRRITDADGREMKATDPDVKPHYLDRMTLPGAGGTADILVSDRVVRTSSATVTLLNDGLYQAQLTIGMPNGIEAPLPAQIFVDIKNAVDGGHPDYPWTTSRERLQYSVERQVRDYIQNKLLAKAVQGENDALQAQIASADPIPGTPYTWINSGGYDDMVLTGVRQGANHPEGSDAGEAAHTAWAQSLGAAFATARRIIQEEFPSGDYTGVRFAGLGSSAQWLGINVRGMDPTGAGQNLFYHNPHVTLQQVEQERVGKMLARENAGEPPEGMDLLPNLAREYARRVLGNIVHEITHKEVWSHSGGEATNFASAMARNMLAIDPEIQGTLLNDFVKLLSDNDYSYLRQLRVEADRLAGATKRDASDDLFSKVGSAEGRTEAPGGPDRDLRGGAGAGPLRGGGPGGADDLLGADREGGRGPGGELREGERGAALPEGGTALGRGPAGLLDLSGARRGGALDIRRPGGTGALDLGRGRGSAMAGGSGSGAGAGGSAPATGSGAGAGAGAPAGPTPAVDRLITAGGKVQKSRYSGALSGTTGALADFLGTGLNAPRLLGRTVLGSLFEQARGVPTSQRATTPAEVVGLARGAWTGLAEAGRDLLRNVLQGTDPSAPEQAEGLTKGPAGLLIEPGGRLRTASDKMYIGLGRSAAAYALAYRQADREGLTFGTPQYRARVNQVAGAVMTRFRGEAQAIKAQGKEKGSIQQGGTAQNRLQGQMSPYGARDLADYDALAREAQAIAKRLTFQQKPGTLVSKVGGTRSEGGLVGWSVMFFRTLGNIGAEALGMTPVGLAGRTIDTGRSASKDPKVAGPYRDATQDERDKGEPPTHEPGHRYARTDTPSVLPASQRDAEVAMGAGLALLGGTLAAAGVLTGWGPLAGQDARAWREEGHRRLAVKIGDTETPLGKVLGPMALPLALGAYSWEEYERNGKQVDPRMVAQVLKHGGIDWANTAGLKSFYDLLEPLFDPNVSDDPLKDVGAGLTKQAVGTLPLTGFARNLQQATDATVRDPQGPAETVAAGLPGASHLVPPRRDQYGEPIRRGPGETGVRALLPLQSSTVRNPDTTYRRFYGSESAVMDEQISRAKKVVDDYKDSKGTSREPTDHEVELARMARPNTVASKNRSTAKTELEAERAGGNPVFGRLSVPTFGRGGGGGSLAARLVR